MYFKSISILFFFFVGIALTSCQTKQKVLDKVEFENPDIDYIVKGSFSEFEVDNLGDIYVFNERNEIQKFDSEGNFLFKNSFNKYGKISYLDVSNPQKILIYFSDFQYVIFLDNTLSEIKLLNLEEFGFWDIKAVCLSNDNFIWIYDPVNFKLIKINDMGMELLSSNEEYFRDLNSELNLYARENEVLLFSEDEILIFSDFGQFHKSEKLQNSRLQFFDGHFVYLQNNIVKARNRKVEMLDSPENKLLELNQKHSDFQLTADGLFLLNKSGVYFEDLDFSN